ncbi:MAG: OmpW family outer membrane protein [Thermoanaerobaculia bacterium]
MPVHSPLVMRCIRPLALVIALGALLPSSRAGAQPFADPGTGVGFLGAATKATGGAQATFVGGAFGITRLTGVLGLELFAGYRIDEYEQAGTTVLRVQQIPVQLSLLAYLLPNLRVQPYLLGGIGYYRIWSTGEGPLEVQGVSIENRFALHAGAGVDVRLSPAVSLRLDGRYVFLDVDAVSALGLSAGSWQAGAGLNVYF